MKRLFVVRHGKAEAKHPDGDFHRALSPRGARDAEALGQWSRGAHVLGSPVLTSPAIRTTQTTALLREAWQADEMAITVLEEGYLASDRAWLGWINALDNRHEQAWIVGHNPGLSELVERLTEQPVWLPTCGMAEVELQIDQWDEAFAGVGRLRGLFTPKSSLCP